MSWQILTGDCRDVLAGLPAASVHTVCTSPPYFGLRDYGHDGQIGLEPTPDEFVQALVGVFREVRRVLRDDGTAWLNLGDSYCSTDKWGGGKSGNTGKHTTNGEDVPSWAVRERSPQIPGVKPKDLLGIPWMVAFALRQPYYDGRIRDERDRIWLAAMIDAEGSIGVNWNRAGEHRARDSYGLSIKVSNTNRAIVARCAEIAGCGSDLLHDRRGRDCFAWSVYGDEARRVLREVYPYLVAKQQEARLAHGTLTHPIYEAVRLLHAGTETTVDAPAPPDCWTPGWYLRSEIIWHKPNPMPESVTDRPTKAHEQVFLLSKGPRYFYDADAVCEEDSGQDHPRAVLNGQPSLEPSNGIAGAHGGIRTVEGRNGAGRNKRTVWTVATQPYAGAHFATFPPKLIEPCILAGCPERCCSVCGAPWERVVEVAADDREHRDGAGTKAAIVGPAGAARVLDANGWNLPTKQTRTLGFAPSCPHNADPMPGTVLDPFAGAGTTGMVALRHNRSFVGIELNEEYARLARDRIVADAPLMNSVSEVAA